MKVLALHVDYVKYKPLKKAIKSAVLKKGEEKEKEIKEALLVLTAVEKGDKNSDEYVKNVKDIASQVKAKNIVLYPYAHLSSNLADPETAIKIMEDAEKKLSKNYKVSRAPFGYYKEFELKCKGHPLAELSRELRGELGDSALLPNAVPEHGMTSDKGALKLLNEISKSKLDTSKLKENDHRILGQKMDLFSFNETAPGMVFWHPNGLIIWNELVKYWREKHSKESYKEISTPIILDKKLWQISGHWEKFKEHIFLTEYEKKEFAVKPMNCPGGILVFKNSPKSYRDLPLRTAELGVVHRQELSGVLGGLFRVIKFTQDDAHVYCTEDQLESEIEKIRAMIDKFYKKFKLSYHVELSTRPKKRIGSEKLWDRAEKILESVLKKKKIKFKINKGDGAFYGPKIDFHIKDSLNRTWQLATIQLDFAMPERFDITYTDKNGDKKRPVMLHRVIYGSLERFIGILLEHTNGTLPTWLSPVQVKVISFTDRNKKSTEKIAKQFQEEGIRVETDLDDKTVNNKVREAEMMHIPYIIVIGDKEEKAKTLAVRKRGEKPKFGVKRDDFLKQIKKEIDDRS